MSIGARRRDDEHDANGLASVFASLRNRNARADPLPPAMSTITLRALVPAFPRPSPTLLRAARGLPVLAVAACSLGELGFTETSSTLGDDTEASSGRDSSDGATTGSSAADGPSDGTTSASGDDDAADTTAPPADGSDDDATEDTATPEPGTIYLERDYEIEDPDEVYCDEVGELTYVPGGGFDGSNAWQMRLFGDVANEDHCGWPTQYLPPLEDGGTRSLFIGHMLWVSSGMVERMEQDHVGGKMIDALMLFDEIDPGTARQTSIWSYRLPDGGVDPQYGDTAATGVLPTLVKGGAGDMFVRQVGEHVFDLRDYTDQWIWTLYVFDADQRYSALWIATQDGVFTGAYDEPVMYRRADDPADWMHQYNDEEPYVYDNFGWEDPGLVWGYWDDLSGKPFTDDDFVRLDHLVVSSGWIESPI